jgi:hypothetical protein
LIEIKYLAAPRGGFFVPKAPLTGIFRAAGALCATNQKIEGEERVITGSAAARVSAQLRAEPRMKVMLGGDLLTAFGTQPCRVLDLSRNGACLDTAEPRRVGEQLTLQRGALAATGTIMWVRGRRFGMRFDAPIRATELFVQLSASRDAQPAPVSSGPICP